MSNIEKHIRNIIPRGMTENEKIRSWNVLEQALVLQPSSFSYIEFLHRSRGKLATLVAGLLIVGMGTATAYASNAKPGDILFPVQIAKEKAQILLTPDTRKKEALRVQFAQKRLVEVRELEALVEVEEHREDRSHEDRTTTMDTERLPSLEEERSVARAKHGAETALRELEATHKELSRSGHDDSAREVEHIISEINAVSERRGRGRDHKEDVGTTTVSGGSREREQEDTRMKSSSDTRAEDARKNTGTENDSSGVDRGGDRKDERDSDKKREETVSPQTQAEDSRNDDDEDRREDR